MKSNDDIEPLSGENNRLKYLSEKLIDSVDSVKVFAIIAFTIVIVISFSLLFPIGSDDATENEFSLEFSEYGVSVNQTDGNFYDDKLAMVITYENQTQSEIFELENKNDERLILYEEDPSTVEKASINEYDATEDEIGEELISKESTLDIPNHELEFSISDVEKEHGENIHFTGSEFVEDEDNITSYKWNMGDGTEYEGVVASHQYTETGTYEVTLTVTDKFDLKHSETFKVDVNSGQNLESKISIDEGIKVGEEYKFSGPDFDSDSEADIEMYRWDFNGVQKEGEFVNHTFENSGTKEVSLTVIDSDGIEDSQNILFDVSYDVQASAYLEYENDGEVKLSAENSTTEQYEIHSYQWEMGDGELITGENVKYQYESNGNYDIELTVIDERGNVDTETVSVTITDVEENDNGDSEESTDDVQSIEFDYDEDDEKYSVVAVSGENSDEILQDNDFGDSNPTLYLVEEQRYEFLVNYENSDVEDYIMALSSSSETLLSPVSSGEYNNDEDVDMESLGDDIFEFTLAEELSDDLEYYESDSNPYNYGNIVIEEAE